MFLGTFALLAEVEVRTNSTLISDTLDIGLPAPIASHSLVDNRLLLFLSRNLRLFLFLRAFSEYGLLIVIFSNDRLVVPNNSRPLGDLFFDLSLDL